LLCSLAELSAQSGQQVYEETEVLPQTLRKKSYVSLPYSQSRIIPRNLLGRQVGFTHIVAKDVSGFHCMGHHWFDVVQPDRWSSSPTLSVLGVERTS
jgi:hypothetical protein